MKLSEQALEYNLRLKEALQLIVDALNQGQQKKIAKDPTVKALLDRYGIQYAK